MTGVQRMRLKNAIGEPVSPQQVRRAIYLLAARGHIKVGARSGRTNLLYWPPRGAVDLLAEGNGRAPDA